LAADWEQWIGPTAAADEVRSNRGSYSIVNPGNNLKIISTNTQFWMRVNFWLLSINFLSFLFPMQLVSLPLLLRR
jgi:hypothetical protein